MKSARTSKATQPEAGLHSLCMGKRREHPMVQGDQVQAEKRMALQRLGGEEEKISARERFRR